MNPANVAATATMEHLGWPVMAKTYSARTMTDGAGSRSDRTQVKQKRLAAGRFVRPDAAARLAPHRYLSSTQRPIAAAENSSAR